MQGFRGYVPEPIDHPRTNDGSECKDQQSGRERVDSIHQDVSTSRVKASFFFVPARARSELLTNSPVIHLVDPGNVVFDNFRQRSSRL